MADVQRGLQRMVLALLTALVLMQTLGVLHRVVHAHSTHGVTVADGATDVPATHGPMDLSLIHI